ncbi:MAG TPA: helix-turn-helix domain-containing protein [Allosphingosinicella sp.]|nr:helix-turn-helix domain-containing protein [Allosphingosinicella sp.]
MASLGPYIRQNVIPHDVSVSDAARRLGVGRPALSNLLNGKAKLSRDMALKLEREFGADANLLIRRQAEEEGRERGNDKARTGRQQAGSYLKIKSTDFSHWADTIGARTLLPVLIRQLVHADCDVDARINFPGHDAGERKGWDGHTVAGTGGHWVPAGKAGWELSVSTDLPGKANRDIQARSVLSLAERAETTFVFVTARDWPAKDDWAEKQRQTGDWREVRAYDAVDLEQWLERSATTQIWFARELGRSVEGIVPISECWLRWSASTKPQLSPLLFEEAIADRRQSLLNWLAEDSEHPFVVVADSPDEALAFIALALREPDGTEGPLHDRAVVVTTPDALLRLAAVSREAILIVADRATELAASSLTRRNRVIVVRPRTSIENDADLTLQTPSSDCFSKALESMGVEEHLREQLKDESGLSPTILRRRLALMPELRTPKWASDRALIRKLMPMFLAGAWNRTLEADQMLVAELAGQSFEQVERDLVDLLALPETPVWAIGSYRGLISRKDALFTAGSELTQLDIDRFFEVAEFILSEDDPALDLEPEKRWSANIYGKTRDISGSMRAAVGELLVLLAVYGNHVLGSHVGPVGVRVDMLVSKLLTGVETRAWLSRQSDLPMLSEASPAAFLEAIELDLASEEPQILAMLRPVDSSAFGDSPDRTGLLWALETIAWDEAYLFRVARVLARLSAVPINDNWVNKPENSLESLIRSWLPQTSAGIDQRIKLVDILVREYPAVGWRLCKAQIDTGHRFASPNSKPRWRTDAAGIGPVTYAEDFEMRRHALDLMLGWETLDRGQLADLIESSVDLPQKEQTTIWRRVQNWIDDEPSDEDRASLREHMRRSVLSRRNRKKVKPDKLTELRRQIFNALAPRDPVDRHRWLFAEQWVSESGDDIWDDAFDYRKHQARVDELRRTAIAEIFSSGGFDALRRLLANVNAWNTVGQFLVLIHSPPERSTLIEALVNHVASSAEPYWIGCLQGAQFALAMEERSEILHSLGLRLPDSKALILFKWAPFEGRTWDLLRAIRPDIEITYWREVMPYGWGHSEGELGMIVDRLLGVDRPISAFNALTHDFDKIEGAMLARLMKALIGPTAEVDAGVQLHANQIQDALDALEASGASSVAELAQLEYLFIKALTHTKHGIRNLEKQIEQSPGDFVHLVSIMFKRDDGTNDPADPNPSGDRVYDNVFSALHEIRRTPGTREDGTVDTNVLINWLIDVRDRFKAVGRLGIGDAKIGELLGRSKPGSDGTWPNEAVRNALEMCGSERMLRGIEIGLFNNRGATWRGPGGTQERTLAAKYREHARQLQSEYPVTSRLLESIVLMWERQAEWHDTDQAVRKRLQRR